MTCDRLRPACDPGSQTLLRADSDSPCLPPGIWTDKDLTPLFPPFVKGEVRKPAARTGASDNGAPNSLSPSERERRRRVDLTGPRQRT